MKFFTSLITMIYHPCVSCRFANNVIVTAFFRALSIINQIMLKRKLCFIFNIETETQLSILKSYTILILSGNRVLNLFFTDLIVNLPFWPWCCNTKRWLFTLVKSQGKLRFFSSIIYTSFVFLKTWLIIYLI